MRDDTEAADLLGERDCRLQCVKEKLSSQPLPLKAPVNGQLAEQHHRKRRGSVAASLLRQEFALDLAGLQVQVIGLLGVPINAYRRNR